MFEENNLKLMCNRLVTKKTVAIYKHALCPNSSHVLLTPGCLTCFLCPQPLAQPDAPKTKILVGNSQKLCACQAFLHTSHFCFN